MQRVPAAEVCYGDQDGRYYRDGLLFTGWTHTEYPSGRRRSESEFRHGLRWGRSREWYPDGRLAADSWFRQDVAHGTSREWHPSGRLASEVTCEYGITLQELEWDDSGVLVKDYRMAPDDPDRESLRTMHAAYGQPHPTPPTVDEPDRLRLWRERERADQATRAAGQPLVRVPQDDVTQGGDGLWYHDGRPLTGISHLAADAGRGATEAEFRQGLRWGASRAWYPDGTPASEGHYRQGVRHGVSRSWYASGQVEGEAGYEFGVIVTQREWTADGTLVEDYHLDPDSPEHRELLTYRRLLAL